MIPLRLRPTPRYVKPENCLRLDITGVGHSLEPPQEPTRIAEHTAGISPDHTHTHIHTFTQAPEKRPTTEQAGGRSRPVQPTRTKEFEVSKKKHNKPRKKKQVTQRPAPPEYEPDRWDASGRYIPPPARPPEKGEDGFFVTSDQSASKPEPPPAPPASRPEPPPAALKELDLIAFNSQAEAAFTVIVWELTHEPCPVPTVISETAFRLDVSPATAKRYLTKYTAPSAPFMLVDKSVCRRYS